MENQQELIQPIMYTSGNNGDQMLTKREYVALEILKTLLMSPKGIMDENGVDYNGTDKYVLTSKDMADDFLTVLNDDDDE